MNLHKMPVPYAQINSISLIILYLWQLCLLLDYYSFVQESHVAVCIHSLKNTMQLTE
jgi:hypothetical protein